MKMRQMPYKVDDGAIERAKYRAKLAIREVAHPAENRSRGVQWRWVTAIAVAAVVTVGVFAFVKVVNKMRKPKVEAPKPAPRLCPFCKSAIADDASRCPHCTSQL